MFHHKHLQKKKLRKKLKTCVTPLIVALIKSGPLELRCELTHNTTTTLFLLCFLACPINFFLYVVFLFLSFFAFTFPSLLSTLTDSQSLLKPLFFFFFLGWEYRPGLWQQKGSEELKQRLFSLLSCILLTHCRQYTQYPYMCVAALLWLRKPEGQTAVYSSLSCTHFAISWSVSVSKEWEFSFIMLDIIKNNQKILQKTINLSRLWLAFYQHWCAGTTWTEAGILQAESRPEVYTSHLDYIKVASEEIVLFHMPKVNKHKTTSCGLMKHKPSFFNFCHSCQSEYHSTIAPLANISIRF